VLLNWFGPLKGSATLFL